MPQMTRPPLNRRLDGLGTTIFTEITALAQKHGAVNLGQGFPNFAGPAYVKDSAARAIGSDLNQYARMAGEPALTRLLLGFGLRNFSMHPAQLLAIKERVLRTNLAEAQPLAQRVLRQSDPRKTRELLAKLNA